MPARRPLNPTPRCRRAPPRPVDAGGLPSRRPRPPSAIAFVDGPDLGARGVGLHRRSPSAATTPTGPPPTGGIEAVASTTTSPRHPRLALLRGPRRRRRRR
uniref:Uncharacterized protein n=1 Tax=Leersia perrieri TaxID=77586 RepID=A0A0D9X7F1_9ORYZ